MQLIISTIFAFIQTYVQAVVVSILSTAVFTAVGATVVNLLTISVMLILTGVVLQVVGKLLGIEKITDGIAKVLYAIAILIVVVAAIIAQSFLLALAFLGGAIVFLYLVDSVFGTEAGKTFTEAGVEIAGAVVDVVGGVIGGVVDIIGTGISSLFGGKLGTYLLLGVGGYILYKYLSKRETSSGVRQDVSSEKPSGNASSSNGPELASSGGAN